MLGPRGIIVFFREDLAVEAYDLAELYIDLILRNLDHILMNKKLDLVVEEAVSSLFWFEPYVVGQKQEFQAVIKDFEKLFGKVKQ